MTSPTHSRAIFTLAIVLGLALSAASSRAALFTDDFNDGTISATIWSPPPTGQNGGNMVESGGGLNFAAAVQTTNTEAPQSKLKSAITAPRDQDWRATVKQFLDGPTAFPGIGTGDLVALGLNLTATNTEVNLNLGMADLGAGFKTLLRFATRSDSNQTETFDVLPQAQYGPPRTAITTLFYDADTTTLSAYMDIGTGVFQEGGSVNTSTWGSGPSEPFFFELFGTAGPFNGAPPHNFTVTPGHAFFDDFELTVAEGGELAAPSSLIAHPRDDIAPVPEASTLAFGLCLVGALANRRLRVTAR